MKTKYFLHTFIILWIKLTHKWTVWWKLNTKNLWMMFQLFPIKAHRG